MDASRAQDHAAPQWVTVGDRAFASPCGWSVTWDEGRRRWLVRGPRPEDAREFAALRLALGWVRERRAAGGRGEG